MKLNNLPPEYKPFNKIKIGSNLLENVQALIEINGYIPILISNEDIPKLWLYIPANKQGTEWYPLIKNNFSSHPDVKIKIKNKKLTVSLPNITILDCEKKNQNELLIKKLDLRPFGLKVYADEKSLYVMGNTLMDNTFKNLSVIIRIGSEGPNKISYNNK